MLILATFWLPPRHQWITVLLVWQYPGWNWRAIVAVIDDMILSEKPIMTRLGSRVLM
jgi:hypothetical protein